MLAAIDLDPVITCGCSAVGPCDQHGRVLLTVRLDQDDTAALDVAGQVIACLTTSNVWIFDTPDDDGLTLARLAPECPLRND